MWKECIFQLRFLYLFIQLSALVTVDSEVTSHIAKSSDASGLFTKTGDLAVVSTPSQNEMYHADFISSLLSHPSLELSNLAMSNRWTPFTCVVCASWPEYSDFTTFLTLRYCREQTESIFAIITRACMRWSGHLAHMRDDCLPKCLHFGGFAGAGGLRENRKRYKNLLCEASTTAASLWKSGIQ